MNRESIGLSLVALGIVLYLGGLFWFLISLRAEIMRPLLYLVHLGATGPLLFLLAGLILSVIGYKVSEGGRR